MRTFERNQRGRMFESTFLEYFSKVHPVAPFVLWLPIVVAIPAWAIVNGVSSITALLVMAPLGFITWQAAEYFVHKKAFHWLGIGPISRRLHEIVHGFHHRFPDDPQRLVMPLAVSVSLACVVGALLWLLDRPALTLPWFTGFLAGYLFYDFMHWSTHFRRPLTRWGKAMREHHLSHHFADIDTNFGISNRWMDRSLGTLKTRES